MGSRHRHHCEWFVVGHSVNAGRGWRPALDPAVRGGSAPGRADADPVAHADTVADTVAEAKAHSDKKAVTVQIG